MEISFNIDSKVWVEFSLLWLFWIFISVDDVPLLVSLSIGFGDLNILVFSIDFTLDLHDLSFIVDNSVSFSSEELPPSRCDT
jgi:hypothetical protein